MSCDACKRIQVLTGSPCQYCGRLNVEAQLAAAQLQRAAKSPEARFVSFIENSQAVEAWKSWLRVALDAMLESDPRIRETMKRHIISESGLVYEERLGFNERP